MLPNDSAKWITKYSSIGWNGLNIFDRISLRFTPILVFPPFVGTCKVKTMKTDSTDATTWEEQEYYLIATIHNATENWHNISKICDSLLR